MTDDPSPDEIIRGDRAPAAEADAPAAEADAPAVPGSAPPGSAPPGSEVAPPPASAPPGSAPPGSEVAPPPASAPAPATGSRGPGRPIQYKGAELDAQRGPGLGCFWFQVAILAFLVVLTPVTVSLGWPSEVSAILLFVTIGLLLVTGQTVIFLLRLVAADRRTRRRPLASASKTVGELEDEGGPGPAARPTAATSGPTVEPSTNGSSTRKSEPPTATPASNESNGPDDVRQ